MRFPSIPIMQHQEHRASWPGGWHLENFKHHFSSTAYGVYAMHGHVFDRFNYEGGSNRTDRDHGLVPIGWKDVTYVMVYTPKEKPNKRDLLVFESWSGSLKRGK